ncbi:DUF924-domain-containing protein [Rhizophagus irregularis]|uniref:DUF924-domain-containing protein n=3 Tax=Rhizophagus irregularis TaxID=588596 RepID=U9TTT0_RHIID|nr:hypothetical protein GLOIN_2v1498620 [Rhizophagus irregularis DAOM 181602=DAOM 197198]EXX57259.1 hypothetical protein RirG_208870 [Rhizophagus irregularis DAOM 197198w]PKC12953.1 DUF924-domain-containing protein [Rhizophagus irregularis]PKC71136.1 DUF924-domain-containing protein [Rhizophagus irregularis]PKK70575.1 DUF924-domain-containing protein [Rhizophagus irregularis]PKY23432.1 DUF924-domain-containing protein [Rhizophagus irregularis]|eukprot:XP_025189313.1 hypothetical protein GLOIN_2v1498620 [Rhizophagus irregularis DAOM 181602=DAOM 197198]
MSSAAAQLQKRILSFWFKGFVYGEPLPPSLMQFWFEGGELIDNECKNSFGKEIEEIFEKKSYVDEMKQTPEGTLGLAILLDQIPRNIFRKTKRPFADFDPIALDVAKYCVDRKWDEDLNPIQREFIYLPFEHSENLEDQEISVRKHQWNVENSPKVYLEISKIFANFADQHKVVIEKFGRFPHRNKYLGRESTKEEIEYLESGGGF